MDPPPGARFLPANLQAPPGFLNVTNAQMAGYYIFGYENFRVLNVSITNVLHRSFAGRQEDFVLGIISVLLIALLSEIVQTVLMRTRERRVTKQGLQTAVVLDEVYHFRNVWRLLRRDPECKERGSTPRRIAYNSLLIVALALMLLAAEVFAVYLTQPIKVYSTGELVNVRGQQPTGTTYEMAVHIDNLTKKKRCVTPSMNDGNQAREYSINACIMRNYSLNMMDENAVATWVEVASWYHEAGSDHRITFGDKSDGSGLHEMETRAFIMLRENGTTKAIRFMTDDTNNHDYAKYLQKFMMYTAIEWNCNEKLDDRSCEEMIEELKPGKSEFETREVKLWEVGDKQKKMKTRKVQGVKCRFRIRLKNPFLSIENALHVFATSAVIREVENKGMYTSLKNGKQEEVFPGLISEEGRVAGLVLLSLIFGVLLLVLVLLRICLRPISLARLARTTMDDDFDAFDDFWGAGPKPQAELKPPIMSSGSLDDEITPKPSPRRHQPFFGRGRKEKERVTDLADFISEEEDYQSSITTVDGV